MKHKYIIISGTSKAATTSVFNYLAAHPSVCESNIKQTNYFLDPEAQEALNLFATHKYNSEAANFDKYFSCSNQELFKLEATPDYMYYEETAKRLKLFSEYKSTKLVFILRNPVSRFLSWYNFGKQQGDIPQEMSLIDFYQASKKYTGTTNPSLMGLKTGYYSKYLKIYAQSFNEENIEIFFYEDLIADPSKFILDFCDRIGLDKSFYDSYDFKHYNKTIKTKSKALNKFYNTLRYFYIKYLFKGFLGIAIGKLLKGILSPIYQKLNTSKLKSNNINEDVVVSLEKDYLEEKNNLVEMFNLKTKPNW